MVEIELVRRRRARRALRRRADLVLAAAVVLVVAVALSVTFGATSGDRSRPARTPLEAGGLPALRVPLPGGPSGSTPSQSEEPGASGGGDGTPLESATSPASSGSGTGATADPGPGGPTAAPASTTGTPAGPVADPPPADDAEDPATDQTDQPDEPDEPDGPLTRTVGPLLRVVTGLLPQLSPLGDLLRGVTSCVDKAVTRPPPTTRGADAGCPASTPSRSAARRLS